MDDEGCSQKSQDEEPSLAEEIPDDVLGDRFWVPVIRHRHKV
jgi:hypothetical protein